MFFFIDRILSQSRYHFLGLFLLIFISFSLLNVQPIQAQLYLVEDSYKGAIAQGPANNAPSVTFFKRVGYNQYAPSDVSTQVEFTLKNMQVEADGVEQVITFGSSARETVKWPKSEMVFQPMKNLGRPISKLFTNKSEEADDILTSSHYGFWMFASVKQYSKNKRPRINEKEYLGDLVMTFNRPISNPILQVVGLGGTVIVENIVRGFSVELELQNRDGSLKKLSGSDELGVSSDRIFNTADQYGALCGSGAACGSVEVFIQNTTELTFRIFLKRDTREDGYRGKWPLMRNMQKGDGFLIGLSFAENMAISGQLYMKSLSNQSKNAIDDRLLRINIIDPVQTKVIGSVPVSEDGSYTIDGLTTKSDYLLQINTIRGDIGEAPPAVQLPGDWRIESFDSDLEGAGEMGVYSFSLTADQAEPVINIVLSDLPEGQIVDDTTPETSTPKDTSIPFEEEPKAIPQEHNELPTTSSNDNGDTSSDEPETEMTMERTEAETQWEEGPQNTDIDNQPAIENNDDCVIIVGSFATEQYANQMRDRVLSKGYNIYVGQSPAGLTRIGYRVSCGNVNAALSEAKQFFDWDAWILE